jgi:DNA helicase HerA-like ATPase
MVVTRILRTGDSWAEIHLDDPSVAERLLGAYTLSLKVTERDDGTVGSVERGSTHERLTFTTSRALEIGMTLAVATPDEGLGPVLYQLSEAEVRESSTRGGSHLVVTATGDQIGRFDADTSRLTLHRWVPPPGSPVTHYTESQETYRLPSNAMLIGHVLGTDLPVFLDTEEVCAGHIAILGMTKMGKTTLAVSLARKLATKRRVVIVDQTGEYQNRRGLPLYDKEAPTDSVGLSVLNLPDGSVGADFALKFVKKIGEMASTEYAAGTTHPRSIIFDEAHQFIPEPAGLGYGSPGRDSAYQLGYEFMQLRKYGVSFGLISQRTAVVAKGALSQCENIIAFRSVDRTGLEYLEQIAGPRVSRLLPTLRQGEALLAGPAFLSDAPVVVKVVDQADEPSRSPAEDAPN